MVLPIPDEAKLSPIKSTETANPDLLKNLEEANIATSSAATNNGKDAAMTETAQTPDGSVQETNSPKKTKCKGETPASLNDNVDTLIEKQKKIEEDNKLKKAAIAKALEDR